MKYGNLMNQTQVSEVEHTNFLTFGTSLNKLRHPKVGALAVNNRQAIFMIFSRKVVPNT